MGGCVLSLGQWVPHMYDREGRKEPCEEGREAKVSAGFPEFLQLFQTWSCPLFVRVLFPALAWVG